MLLLIMAMGKQRPEIRLGLPISVPMYSVPIMAPWVMGPILGTHVPGFQHSQRCELGVPLDVSSSEVVRRRPRFEVERGLPLRLPNSLHRPVHLVPQGIIPRVQHTHPAPVWDVRVCHLRVRVAVPQRAAGPGGPEPARHGPEAPG